jgi:hypothetical protein
MFRRAIIGLAAALLSVSLAHAQASVRAGCFTTNGNNCVPAVQASASVPINVSTATTTQLVAISGTATIFVTAFDLVGGGTGNATLVYGTGSNCATGTTSLTGPYPLVAQTVITKGSGHGPVLVVPSGNALCITTSAAVQLSGSVSYAQFSP